MVDTNMYSTAPSSSCFRDLLVASYCLQRMASALWVWWMAVIWAPVCPGGMIALGPGFLDGMKWM